MLPDILPPVLHSFNDQDPRVRYYACESVYNICKVARGGCMPLFEPLFDAICKLVADGDANVRNAAQVEPAMAPPAPRDVPCVRLSRLEPFPRPAAPGPPAEGHRGGGAGSTRPPVLHARAA